MENLQINFSSNKASPYSLGCQASQGEGDSRGKVNISQPILHRDSENLIHKQFDIFHRQSMGKYEQR